MAGIIIVGAVLIGAEVIGAPVGGYVYSNYISKQKTWGSFGIGTLGTAVLIPVVAIGSLFAIIEGAKFIPEKGKPRPTP